MPVCTDPPSARAGDPDWTVDAARLPNREVSAFWRVGGFVWHVQRKGSGPKLLLLHGTGAGTHSWAPLIELLAPHFETINLDLPGHGFTRTPSSFRPSLSNISVAVRDLLKELELSPEMIAGHSAGAAIALQLTASRALDPKLLISINGALKPFDGIMRSVAPMTAKVASFGGIAARLVARNPMRERRVRNLVQQLGSDPDRVDVASYSTLLRRRGHIQGALQMMAHWDLTQIATICRRIEQPVLFIAGDADKAVPPIVSEQAAGQVQHGTYLELAQLGHLAHEEAPDLVASTIREAWARYGA